MSLEHTCLPIENQWVIEARDFNLVPCLTEHYVTLHNLIFKCRPEAALRCVLLDYLLDLTSDATNCANLSSLELGNLELAVKHALDKRGILVDLERLSDQLELFHDAELRIHLDNCTCHTDAEVGHILASLVLQLLDTDEGSADGVCRTVEGGITETEFRCVFNHPKTLSFNIIVAVDWHCLELPPTH